MALKLKNGNYVKIRTDYSNVINGNTYIAYCTYRDDVDRNNEKTILDDYEKYRKRVNGQLDKFEKELEKTTTEDERKKVLTQFAGLISDANALDGSLFSFAQNVSYIDFEQLKKLGAKTEWKDMKLLPISHGEMCFGKVFESMKDFDIAKAYDLLKTVLDGVEDC